MNRSPLIPPRAPVRCSTCGELGHNRVTCPQSDVRAVITAPPEGRVIAAFRVVVQALDALKPDERKRLMSALQTLFNVSGKKGKDHG